jgi:hypothetical protein
MDRENLNYRDRFSTDWKQQPRKGDGKRLKEYCGWLIS